MESTIQDHTHRTNAAASRRPLTLFLWVLIGYLCIDAAVRGAQVADLLQTAQEYTRTILLQCAFQLLFSVLELLIVLQIFVRTIAARVFGSGLLLVHLGYSSYTMAFRSPDTWLMLDTSGRLAFLGQLVFLAVALVLLNRRPCRLVLAH